MEDEIKNFIKVWISALASLTYCYLIPSKIPKGQFRLLSLLPIIFFFTILPLNLTTVSLGGCTAFFLTWLSRVSPSWEVTCFFVLQGLCVAIEILVKKVVKDRWRLHPVVSGPLTVGFVMVTGSWLFFPQLIRCETEVRSSREVVALVGFVKDLGWALKSFAIQSVPSF
ncbi:hypothetical protein BVC80_9087g49 [Macleaya cordata]|uniref:Uncharacterized protein n=1 Tax=Macleaya cordata TaxID=56857 RepID=A0A200PQR9_MACCD|nr:hypothetical protein BVC80_9087g49 [Macleaya cordata]